MLARLDDPLSQLVASVEGMVAAPPDQPIEFSGVRTYADALADALATLPQLPADESANQVRAAIESVRLAAESALTNMEQRLQAVAAQSDQLREQMSQTSTGSTAALDELRTEIADLSTTITQEKVRLDEALRANQATFDQAQTQRQSDYTTRVDAAEQTFRDSQESIETEARTKAEAAEASATQHLATLEELVERAKEQVGVIGRTGMSAGYQKDADKEEKAADFWRYATI